MKTITLKADERFDAELTGLAASLHTTKSQVIRSAVMYYKKQLQREALARRVREASLKTRLQAEQAGADFDAAIDDGL
jgi:hypothetical protein